MEGINSDSLLLIVVIVLKSLLMKNTGVSLAILFP